MVTMSSQAARQQRLRDSRCKQIYDDYHSACENLKKIVRGQHGLLLFPQNLTGFVQVLKDDIRKYGSEHFRNSDSFKKLSEIKQFLKPCAIGRNDYFLKCIPKDRRTISDIHHSYAMNIYYNAWILCQKMLQELTFSLVQKETSINTVVKNAQMVVDEKMKTAEDVHDESIDQITEEIESVAIVESASTKKNSLKKQKQKQQQKKRKELEFLAIEEAAIQEALAIAAEEQQISDVQKITQDEVWSLMAQIDPDIIENLQIGSDDMVTWSVYRGLKIQSTKFKNLLVATRLSGWMLSPIMTQLNIFYIQTKQSQRDDVINCLCDVLCHIWSNIFTYTFDLALVTYTVMFHDDLIEKIIFPLCQSHNFNSEAVLSAEVKIMNRLINGFNMCGFYARHDVNLKPLLIETTVTVGNLSFQSSFIIQSGFIMNEIYSESIFSELSMYLNSLSFYKNFVARSLKSTDATHRLNSLVASFVAAESFSEIDPNRIARSDDQVSQALPSLTSRLVRVGTSTQNVIFQALCDIQIQENNKLLIRFVKVCAGFTKNDAVGLWIPGVSRCNFTRNSVGRQHFEFTYDSILSFDVV
jgi:hypothetical protein